MKFALTVLLVLLGTSLVSNFRKIRNNLLKLLLIQFHLSASETVGQKLDSTIDAASEGVQNAADAVKDTAKDAKYKAGRQFFTTKIFEK